MSKITHGIAVVLGVATTFLVTPAGEALVKQYPWLTAVSSALGIALVYFNPKKGA